MTTRDETMSTNDRVPFWPVVCLMALIFLVGACNYAYECYGRYVRKQQYAAAQRDYAAQQSVNRVHVYVHHDPF